ncbi:hypothetical protein AB3U99_21795 [Niallia sp. JL1B1071]
MERLKNGIRKYFLDNIISMRREDAIADGILVDLTETAKVSGINFQSM